MKKASPINPFVLAVLFIFTTGVLFVLGFATGVTGSATSAVGLKVCTDYNQLGACRTLAENTPAMKALFGEGVGISSVRAPPSLDTAYFLCVREDYRWPCRKAYKEDLNNLATVKFSVDHEYVKKSAAKPAHETLSGTFNDNVRSVVVAKYRADINAYDAPFPIFCTNAYLKGDCMAVRGDYANFEGFTATSGEIGKLPSPSGYASEASPYTYHVHFNDKFASFIVPSGWSVTVFTDTEFSGAQRTFKGPTYLESLEAIRLDRQISSIKVKEPQD